MHSWLFKVIRTLNFKPIILSAIILLFLAQTFGIFFPVSYSAAPPTFGKAVNISADAASAQDPNVKNVGTHVYVVWTERSGGIKFRSSPDGGMTWNPPLTKPALRISSAGGTSQYPLMSANSSNVFVVWAQTIGATGLQIMETTSLNSGASFGAPVQLTTGSPVGGYIGPVISSWGNNVYVAYTNSSNNQHAFVTCSANAGARGSWTKPLLYGVYHEAQIYAQGGKYVYPIADYGNSLVESSNNCGSFSHINQASPVISEPWIWGYGSNVYAAWEGKGSGSHITFTKTNDHGASWSTPTNFSLPDVWAPQIGAFGNSAWIATQQHPGSSASQIFIFTTANGGTSWSAPISLSGIGSSTSNTGFPFTVATSDGRNVFVAWSQQVTSGYWVMRASYSANDGVTWSAPPGINVSQNPSGEAGNNNDVANGAISAFGTHCYAAWQFMNGASSQIFFASS